MLRNLQKWHMEYFNCVAILYIISLLSTSQEALVSLSCNLKEMFILWMLQSCHSPKLPITLFAQFCMQGEDGF